MATEIRKASIAEIDIISSLANIAFRDTYKEILSPEQMEYMMNWMYSKDSLQDQMTNQKHLFYLLSVDGKDVGYLSINRDPNNKLEDDNTMVFHLQKIYLLPSEQGKSLGKALLLHAEKSMKEIAGSKKVIYELNVNRYNKALTFYQHHGMTISEEGDFDIGNGYYMNDYIMKKEL